MIQFLLGQALRLFLTLLGVSLVSFLIIRLIPGDPVLLLLGERGGTEAMYQQMRMDLGLHLPIHQQYFQFLTQALQGDLGQSIVSRNTVWSEFMDLFPATIELGLSALLLAIILGIPLGVFSALYRGRWPDYILMSGSLVGYSMPIFWWGLLLILFFSVNLGLTPVAGRISFLYDVEPWTGFMLIDSLHPLTLQEEGFDAFKSALHHLILPTIALATIPMAVIARMTRAAMLEVLHEDYIRTAYAKGLRPWRVIFYHALRNALIPITTVIGLLFGSLITGAILTETIFAWPGVGRWLVSSINARDYPVIQGAILVMASFIVILNAFIDILYRLINPRLRQ